MNEFDGDPRGFPGQLSIIHRRIGRGLGSAFGAFVTGGNPFTAGARGFVTGGGGKVALAPPTSIAEQCRRVNEARRKQGLGDRTLADCTARLQIAGFAPSTPSPFVTPSVFDPSEFGHGTAPEDFGEAVMGRFGAALVPAAVATTTLRCPRGAVLVLGDDAVGQ